MQRHNQQSPPSAVATSPSLTLPPQYQMMFKQLNAPVFKVYELVSGVKLAKIVNKILYDGNNPVLSNSIITQNEERKGNNVINMNMVLKQVKSNNKVLCPKEVEEFTTFKLIDSQEEMIKFVKWIYEVYRMTWKGESARKVKQSHDEQKQNMFEQKKAYKHNKNEDKIIRIIDHEENQHNTRYEYQQQNGMNQSPNRHQNAFENVFFCDQMSPQKVDTPINDSLDQSEKVSKKGSFKVIRPKSNFDDKKSQNAIESDKSQDLNSPQKDSYDVIDENRRDHLPFQRYYSDEKQTSARKTVPKMADRPPIYRKLNKQQTKTQTQSKNKEMGENFKEPSPFSMEPNPQSQNVVIKNFKNSETQRKNMHQKQNRNINMNFLDESKLKNSNLFEQIQSLEQEIQKQALENQSLRKQKHNISRASHNLSTQENKSSNKTKSNRKLFKIQIKQVTEIERKSIIQWLISINLLNSMATTYYDRFHEICKNGIIFPQIINRQKGRSNDLCYFKNPIKSAEIHSNYQKVFDYLKQLPNFQNELLYQYDYFVPEALENAFWSLLKSCQMCFEKSGSKSKNKTFTRDSAIRQRLNSNSQNDTSYQHKTDKQQVNSGLNKQKSSTISFSPLIPNELGDYQKIKYGSTQKFKEMKKSAQKKPEIPKKIEQTPSKQQKSKRKSSLDFIKELPEKQIKFKHQQLVQIQQPIQTKTVKGYRDLHEMKKSHNTSSFINTPQKKKTESSLTGSRIVTANSIKKLSQKPQQPSITLQMQMRAIKYLKQKGYLNLNTLQSLSLFEDPIRNGMLMNKIIIQQTKTTHKYNMKPRNIIDCRQNFKKGFTQMKQAFIIYPPSYEIYYEDIIKGQLNLFYGIIFHILTSNFNKHALNLNQHPIALKNQSAILNISKNGNFNYDQNFEQTTLSDVLFWIRELQQESTQISSMQIRDYNALVTNILCNNFLYKIATVIFPEKYTLKPTYEEPINHMEQESNIKKILSFYAHNKVLKSELAWKAKSIVKKEKSITLQVMKGLMNYAKSVRKSAMNMKIEPENPVISFVKFARQNSRQQIKGTERNTQRLETTMANNSFATTNPNPQSRKFSQNKNKKQAISIEIPWMRQLGFTQDLSLNNGVILCRLISKLTMQSLNYNQNPTSKAECLTNIRKALKLIDKFKWDDEDIASADEKTTTQIYKFIKDKYKHSYALKSIS